VHLLLRPGRSIDCSLDIGKSRNRSPLMPFNCAHKGRGCERSRGTTEEVRKCYSEITL
jgi:hypothetical protein